MALPSQLPVHATGRGCGALVSTHRAATAHAFLLPASQGKMGVMQAPGLLLIVLALSVAASACTSSSLPTLPPVQPPPQSGNADSAQTAIETALVVSGSPTSIYALVARGAQGCWFGADGALRPTHVFQAEADPPAKGGAAEIVIHERDESLRDKRGARAYRISFTSEPLGARVGIAMLKMEPQLAQLMVKDIEVWAKGGTGCQARRLAPAQPLTPVAGKGEGNAKGKKRAPAR